MEAFESFVAVALEAEHFGHAEGATGGRPTRRLGTWRSGCTLAGVDWVQAVGYQHEVVHTGVLEHLLNGESRVTVAQALLGDEAPAILSVEACEREKQMRRRRPIDLAAILRLPADRTFWLGVEVKVDSRWTYTQLTSTIDDGDAGVLLAVGCTALAATQSDLPPNWRLVGPAKWATIIEAHTNGDEALTAYARHVRDEAESHERARDAVNAGRPVEQFRKGSALGHWAYFCEVVAHSALEPSSGSWERKTLISGPLLTRWIDRDDAPDCGVYIELMGHEGEDRELCVKCWADSDSLEALRDRVARCLDNGAARPCRRLRRATKSCTAWSITLRNKRPQDAASLCDELVSRLQVIALTLTDLQS